MNIKRHLRIFAGLIVFVVAVSATAFAAPLTQLRSVRWSSNNDRDRIVFEMSANANYKVFTENDGSRIIVELFQTADKSKKKPVIRSSQIKTVKYDLTNSDRIRIIIDMNDAAEYTVKRLGKPDRIFIDIDKNFETATKRIVAPGITHITYKKRTIEGNVSAHFLDIDNRKYNIGPALAGGVVVGRQTTKKIAAENNAIAAINASYFDGDGTILGYLRLNNTTVGTTYFNRSALGIRKDGTVLIGKLTYNCAVSIGKKQLFISGVNCPRGENGLVIYNRYYDKKTGTNEYGKEYLVRGNIVSLIKGYDTEIPNDGVIISVHGTAKNVFKNVRVGEKVVIKEDIGREWAGISDIIGAGPCLVKNGRVCVTADEEEFPDDIRVGRAPRTAFGVLKNGHYLLAVVDGRQYHSIGCSLNEWAELLLRQGACEAINFDGGGSSEMIFKNMIVNSPSDGCERPVGSALIVTAK